MRTRVGRLLIPGFLCLCAALTSPAALAQAAYEFNLPQQSLADSLRAIGRQTAMNILFEPASVENQTAPAIRGRFSAEEAIKHALAGTQLAAQQTAADTVLVRPMSGASTRWSETVLPSAMLAAGPPELTRPSRSSNRRLRLAQADTGQGVGEGSSPAGARRAQDDERTSAGSPREVPILDEVIVSVERYEQSLQSYEGTAMVTSQANLDVLGASDLLDLPAVMPGLEIANYESNTELYVRGIGSNANTELGDPAVAPHLDDVYVPRPRGLGVAFFDIERVEVNVGPQGTVRGRNALGGTVNLVSRKPTLGQFEAYAEYSIGDYDQQELRGALNVPIGAITAARLAVYSSEHDEYVENTGPLNSLFGWESQDDIGVRAHFLVEPNDRFSVLLSGDFLNSRGTGSRGVDFFNAADEGLTVDDFDDDVRQVNMVGFSPEQDTDHWGAALNATYRTDFVNVQYIGGYRDLAYSASHSTSGRNIDFPLDEQVVVERGGIVAPNDPLAPAFVEERYYGNYSALIWDTTSESRTHELRFTSPDDAERLTWAVGLYKFKEEQAVFLGIPLDYNTNLPYLEFNQGETIGESESVYADVTFALTDRLRVTGGARYSDESKERVGFNFIAGLDTNDVAIRTNTPGFRMTGLDRGLKNPDANGDGVPNTVEDFVLLYQAGVASFGVSDTLDEFLAGQCVQASAFQGTCAGYPGLGFAFGSATVQQGQNSDQYVDWRFRVGYDLTDDNLLYLLVATGNKAPSFNDTVDVDTGPGEDLFTPPVGPEKSTMYEIGSKNTFDIGGNPLVLNASAYYVDYTDQVFSALVGIELLDNDPANDAGCQDTNPNTPCSTITLNQNIGESTNIGVQLDAAYRFGRGFSVSGTLLWQDTEYKDGSVVTDGRRNSPAGSTLQVDLGGNELPRTPPLTFNVRLGQDIDLPTGTLDWVASATYKSSHFLTAFNAGPGEDGAREVTAVDANGVATAYGAELLRLFDEVDAYAHLDLGVGYTHGNGNVRIEGFVNNLTDEAHQTQSVIDGTTQEFTFNPPRTYGVRVRVNF
jgi:iron complex outermembrane receptor protein